MREAVIVSTARTPIGKAYRGAFNDTQAQTLGGHAIANALAARIRRSRRGRRRGDGRGDAARRARRQCRAAGAAARRPSDQRRRHVARPAMRLWPDGDRDRGEGNHRRRHERHHRRRTGIHFAGPERQDEPVSRSRPLARRAPRRPLHEHARDGRDRGGAIPGHASAAGRIRAAVATKNRGRRKPLAGSTPRSRPCPP